MSVDTLWKDASRTFQVAAVARQAAALIVSIILVKGALSQADIGLYEEWFYLGSILTFLLVSGLVQAFAASYGQDSGRDLIFQAYWILMAGLVGVAVIIFLLSDLLIPFLCGVAEIPSLGLVLVFLVLHFGAALVPYYLLVLQRSLALVIFGIAYLVAFVLAVSVGVAQGRGLDSILPMLLIFAIIEHVYLVYLLAREGVFRFNGSVARDLLQRTIPLAGYSFIGALGLLFDAWLVNHHFADLNIFAIFRYGARELPGALALAGAFSAAMLPALTSSGQGTIVKNGLQRLRGGATRLMHLFMPLSILLMLISPWLFRYVYNESFVPSAELFNVYLLLMIARWVFAHTVLISFKREKILFIVSLAELALNICLSIWWLSVFGLVGIAYATVVAYVFEKIVMVLLLRKRHGLSPQNYVHLSWWSGYSVLLIAAFIIAKIYILPV